MLVGYRTLGLLGQAFEAYFYSMSFGLLAFSVHLLDSFNFIVLKTKHWNYLKLSILLQYRVSNSNKDNSSSGTHASFP